MPAEAAHARSEAQSTHITQTICMMQVPLPGCLLRSGYMFSVHAAYTAIRSTAAGNTEQLKPIWSDGWEPRSQTQTLESMPISPSPIPSQFDACSHQYWTIFYRHSHSIMRLVFSSAQPYNIICSPGSNLGQLPKNDGAAISTVVCAPPISLRRPM